MQKLTSARFACLSLVLCWGSLASGQEIYTPCRVGGAELRIVDTIPVAVLTGTPEELGRQHAALLAPAAREALEFPHRMFQRLGREYFLPLAISAGSTLMKNAPERYRTEIDAAVQAAPFNPGQLAVSNTMLELSRLGCATLVVEPQRSETGGLLFGRNFDFPPLKILDRFALVKVIRPTDRHAFAEVGYPGLMGVISGMNDAGLCIATLDVYQTADHSPLLDPTGVPLMLTFRQILEECTTVDEAYDLLAKTPRTTRANLAVCDTRQGAVLEITPTHLGRRASSGGVLPCTNHFRTAGLTTGEHCRRYDKLAQLESADSLGITDVHAALDTANQGELTLHTMIFEPAELRLHLVLGTPPSSAHPLHTLELKALLQVKTNVAAEVP